MKIRNGFVSNSSSSSFVLMKEDLTKFQKCAIKHHLEFGKLLGMENCEECDRWSVTGLKTKSSATVILSTSMTNFNMREFLNKIGVPDDKVPIEEEW